MKKLTYALVLAAITTSNAFGIIAPEIARCISEGKTYQQCLKEQRQRMQHNQTQMISSKQETVPMALPVIKKTTIKY